MNVYCFDAARGGAGRSRPGGSSRGDEEPGGAAARVRRVLIHSYRAARRIVVGTVGATVLAIGLALTVLPGPAFVVIPVGLAILGLEFAWARRWLRHLKAGASAVKNGWERRRGGGGAGGGSGSAALALVALLPLVLGGRCGSVAVRFGLPDAATGQLRVEIRVQGGLHAGDLEIALDGADATGLFSPNGRNLVGLLDDPAPGPHRLAVRHKLIAGLGPAWSVPFESPEPAPALLATQPEEGAEAVPRTAWLRFEFAEEPAPGALAGWGFGVECGGERIAADVLVVRGTSVVVNPAPELPAAASCRAAWRGPGGEIVEHPFTVASDAPGSAAEVLYDRSDPFAFPPIPDDYWLVPSDAGGTGLRVAIEAPPYPPGILRAAANGVAGSLAGRDGWSPVQPIVVALSHAPDLGSLPRSEAESLDPFAAVGLYDMDPASPDYGERFPFTLARRSDYFPADRSFDHTLVLFPARRLRPGGVYALAVTRRLVAAGAPGRPLGPSAFFAAVAGQGPEGAAGALSRARGSIAPVLAFLGAVPELPIPREDLALALRVTIRSEAGAPADWVAVKELALAAPPPALDVASETTAPGGDLVLRGSLELPFYLDGSYTEVNRDAASGAPRARPDATERERRVPFVFRIPGRAAAPLPVVIYQHGAPGSPEEINSASEEFLLEAGYALIGIQDFANRAFGEERSAQSYEILARVAFAHHMPLLHFQTDADLFGLLRAVQAMGSAGNFPEIDPSRIYFRGISYGAHHALGFLPLSPEVTAAVAVAGGGRYFENVIHQIDFLDTFSAFQALVPDGRPGVLLAGFAALQGDADRDDPALLARYLYREPLEVAGQRDDVPASLLWIEGVGDRVVSGTATRAAADELGLPLVGPAAGLGGEPRQAAPVAGNIAPGVTGGRFRYAPASTPSCVASGQTEAHFCPQSALEAEAQILHFFATAARGAPEILDPLEDAR